jgi:hypothetical protein
MKVAFLISRNPEYRLYAPVIEAALTRGWEVECWHDYSEAQVGLKGYQFPSIESVPAFRNGRPAVRSYQGRGQLRAWLTKMRTDAVVAWGPPQAAIGLPLPTPRPLWVCQQYRLDSMVAQSPDGLLACDLLAWHSRWWHEWAGAYFASEGLLLDRDGYLRAAAARTAFVGFPELDAAPLIDADQVRRRWGIPSTQPVVVLFPFPQGVGRATFWPKRICAEPSRLRQLVNIGVYRRFEYLRQVMDGESDPNVVKAIRRFCDRNGAYLLVKSRTKTPIPRYTRDAADQCVYDEGFYPATVLEALSIASLSIGYYTNAVFESVALGVPNLCVTYTAEDYLEENPGYFPRFYTPDEGGPFQFRGVSTAVGIPQALELLSTRTLADFAMDPRGRERYVERFLTHTSGDAGARVLDAVEQVREQSGRTA